MNETLLWESLLEKMKEEIEFVPYMTWIEPIKLISFDRERAVIHLQLKNQFARTWIDMNYIDSMVAHLKEVTFREFSFEYSFRE